MPDDRVILSFQFYENVYLPICVLLNMFRTVCLYLPYARMTMSRWH